MYNPTFNTDEFVKNFLPKRQRLPKWIAFMKGLLAGVKRSQSIFSSYIAGNLAADYDGGVFYSIDDEVMYNYGIYKSLIDNNNNNTPDSNPLSWEKILDSFIGVEESSRFTANRLVLEWALNRYFKRQLAAHNFVGFVQPDHNISPTRSSIYIDNLPPSYVSFVSFAGEYGTSLSYTDKADGYSFTADVFGSSTTYLFTVNIPTLVYLEIWNDMHGPGPSSDAETVIRKFLDKYVPCGIGYTITQY